jgi:signal transduction histidine kinase
MAGVLVSVRDNGPGISSKDAETLFEPFYTTKSAGLGQGLSICRRIIQAHGGQIWAEQAADAGAQFLFWLPSTPGA